MKLVIMLTHCLKKESEGKREGKTGPQPEGKTGAPVKTPEGKTGPQPEGKTGAPVKTPEGKTGAPVKTQETQGKTSPADFKDLINKWEEDLLKLYEGDDEVNPDGAESYKTEEIQKNWNSDEMMNGAAGVTKTIVELRTLIGLRELFKLGDETDENNNDELQTIGLKSLLG